MVVSLMPYKVLAFGLSDIGLVRQNNEDVWMELPSIGFFALADGMGGHQAGEVAARETVEAMCRGLKKKMSSISDSLTPSDVQDVLRRLIRHVNQFVYKMSREQAELRGMGTTLCCLLFRPTTLVYAHVGDSRIYRLRQKKLDQLTKDHSLLRELVDQGQINEQQATDFLYKNIITKAIGTEPRIEPTIGTSDLKENDIYLMCSDGLSDLLTAREIEQILIEFPNPQKAAQKLVAQANQKGGRDNITVVITKIEGWEDETSKDLSR